MKVRNGINPDYADFEELDIDAIDAVEEWRLGLLSTSALCSYVGKEEVARLIAEENIAYRSVSSIDEL